MGAEAAILVLNCGSSSVKGAAFSARGALALRAAASAERVGTPQARLVSRDADGRILHEEPLDAAGHEAAIGRLLAWFAAQAFGGDVVAVGHRIVHGGQRFARPCLVTGEVRTALQALSPLAPLHLPHNLAGVDLAARRWAGAAQVACFDTAFHGTLPGVARLAGLPRALHDRGLRRFGFHGLSYESIINDLLEREGPAALEGRLIIAHLGSGASMAAVRNGHCVETTMGFSTLGGLVMATRCGDADPGLLLYLLQQGIVDLPGLQQLLYERSGLLGVSGSSGDMRDLLAAADSAPAREAVDLFCYSARKHLAALTSTLGGLDRLVFTGGVGEHAAAVRAGICAGLDYLGIRLDAARNERHERCISAADAPVLVQVVASDEARTIARQARDLLAPPAGQAS